MRLRTPNSYIQVNLSVFSAIMTIEYLQNTDCHV